MEEEEQINTDRKCSVGWFFLTDINILFDAETRKCSRLLTTAVKNRVWFVEQVQVAWCVIRQRVSGYTIIIIIIIIIIILAYLLHGAESFLRS